MRRRPQAPISTPFRPNEPNQDFGDRPCPSRSILKRSGVLWWLLLGVLLIGFCADRRLRPGDGGYAALRGEDRRGAPDGDQYRRRDLGRVTKCGSSWAAALIFAAWPFVYAVSFSGFYLAMFLVLSALILRPVGFKYRSKHPDEAWRARWDWALFVGGLQCPRWSSASRSAVSDERHSLASIPICAPSTKVRCSGCSRRSRW